MDDSTDHSRDQTKQEIHVLLGRLSDMITDTLAGRAEIDQLGDELQSLLETGRISRLHYDIQIERLRRSYEKSRSCMRDLERHRKVLVYCLRQLGA